MLSEHIRHTNGTPYKTQVITEVDYQYSAKKNKHLRNSYFLV